MSERITRVGVAAFVFNEAGEFLVGLRKGSHGAGTWGLPGGHIEFGEDVASTVMREVVEETGMTVDQTTLCQAGYSEHYFPKEEKHYVTCFVACRASWDKVELREPEKCVEWRWVSKESLPEPLFPPLDKYLLLNPIPRPKR